MEKTITRKELYDMGWTKPLYTIAKEFNLSYQELKMIYEKNNIPTPPNGYWQKIAFGKVSLKIPLANIEAYNEAITMKGKEKIKRTVAEKKDKKKPLIIKAPNKLSTQDDVIQKLQKELTEREKYATGSNDLIRTAGKNSIVAATKSEMARALRIFDTLIKRMRALNYQIELGKESLTVLYLNEYTHVFIREKCQAKYIEGRYSLKERILTPTGKLAIRVGRWGQFEFLETVTIPLEEKIDAILLKIHTEFEEAQKRNIKWEAEKVKKEEEDRIAAAILKRKEDELNKFLAYFNDAHRWKKYIVLEEYFTYLKANILKSQDEIDWIAKKLEWYNPSIESSDELLSEVDKETLTFIKKKTSFF